MDSCAASGRHPVLQGGSGMFTSGELDALRLRSTLAVTRNPQCWGCAAYQHGAESELAHPRRGGWAINPEDRRRTMLVALQDVFKWLASRISSERGVTAVEYGIMVSLIAVVIIGSVTLLGNNLDAVFNDVANTIGP
jgi:pilus assembly protein Flp/PilA